MTAPETVEVVCPECRNTFLVPDGAPETVCPQCSEHIVWRRCLDTDQVFPVLTKWTTWVHPGCDSVHVVDLTVKIAQPTPEAPPAPAAPPVVDTPPAPAVDAPAAETPAAVTPPAPFCLVEDAQWVEQDLRGQLMIDPVAIGIAGPSAGPVAIAWTRDVLDYALTPHPSAPDAAQAKRRFGRKKTAEPIPILLILTSRAGQHTVTGYADIDSLRQNLEQKLRPTIAANTTA
jgi:hypothetical protein